MHIVNVKLTKELTCQFYMRKTPGRQKYQHNKSGRLDRSNQIDQSSRPRLSLFMNFYGEPIWVMEERHFFTGKGITAYGFCLHAQGI